MQISKLSFNKWLALIAGLATPFVTHAHPGEVTYDLNWDIGTDGDWDAPANWGFTISYPNDINHNAHIPNDGLYTINITDGIHTHDFDNNNPQATVRLRHREIHFVHGNFHNEGLYIIDDAEIAGSQLIQFENDSILTGSGRIELNGIDDGSSTRIQIREGSTLTHGQDHTISGIGRIEGSIINHGTIESAVPDKVFVYQAGDSQNTGLLVSNAGQFFISGGSILNTSDDNSIQGHILADGGAVRLGGTTITGGILESRNNSDFILGGTTLIDTTLLGEMTAKTYSQSTFEGRVTNNAYIIVNPDELDTHSTIIWANENATIDGNGTIDLHDNIDGGQAYNGGRIWATSGATLTIGQQQTVLGSGSITGSIINYGTINASRDGHQLEIFGTPLVNNGILKATNNATLILDINSVISQPSDRYILADNAIVQLTKADISGGSFESIGTGYFVVEEDSTIDSVVLNAPLRTDRQEKLFLRNALTNNDTLTVNHDGYGGYTILTILSDLTIDGTGTLVLHGSTSNAAVTSASGTDTLTNAHGHTIVGGGQIDTPLLNQGTIEIGIPPIFVDSDPIRTMRANAPITMAPTGTLRADVSGAGTTDLLDSTSTFHAAGTLDISYLNDFIPLAHWSTTVITADEGITGLFDTIIAPQPPADHRLTFRVRYFPNEIQVGVYCKADFDYSGELNFFDISSFLTDYGNHNPNADLNADGMFNFFDVSAFLAAFGAGCP